MSISKFRWYPFHRTIGFIDSGLVLVSSLTNKVQRQCHWVTSNIRSREVLQLLPRSLGTFVLCALETLPLKIMALGIQWLCREKTQLHWETGCRCGANSPSWALSRHPVQLSLQIITVQPISGLQLCEGLQELPKWDLLELLTLHIVNK